MYYYELVSMSAGETSTPVDLNRITLVLEFASKLTGVEGVVFSSEGLPLLYTGASQEEAEAVAALSVDVVNSAYRILEEAYNRKPHSILIDTGDGKAVSLSKVRGVVITIHGRVRMLKESLRAASLYLEDRRIKCQTCGGDLTLKTHVCPHCGASIPFVSRECPMCGGETSVKTCPYCGSLVTSEGKRVEKQDSSITREPSKEKPKNPLVGNESRKPGLSIASRIIPSIAGVLSGLYVGTNWGLGTGLIIGVIVGVGASFILFKDVF